MRQHLYFRRALTPALFCAAATMAPSILTAQNTPAAPSYLMIRVDHTKRMAGANEAMDAFQKDVTAADKKGGGPFRVILSSYMGELGTYISISPLQSLGELDGQSRVQKTLGPEAYKALNDRAASLLGGPSRRMIAVPQNEMGIVKERKAPGKFTVWTEYRIQPGKAEDWLKFWTSDVLPAYQKVGAETLYLFRVIYGGNGATFISARTVTSLAELDGGPLFTKAYGAEAAAKISAKLAGLNNSVISSIYRLRTELGNWPSTGN